jgi:hypothetical protein
MRKSAETSTRSTLFCLKRKKSTASPVNENVVSENILKEKQNSVGKEPSFRYKRLKVSFMEDNEEHLQSMSTPEHSSMISTFLRTPLIGGSNKNKSGNLPRAPFKTQPVPSSPGSTSGVRVLFHTSPRDVKYSPLVFRLSPPNPVSSPMMYMVNMDLDCFEKAMDALSPPPLQIGSMDEPSQIDQGKEENDLSPPQKGCKEETSQIDKAAHGNKDEVKND